MLCTQAVKDDTCGITLNLYSHQVSRKNMPDTVEKELTRVLAGKPKLSPFLVNWENVVFICSIFFII